MEKPPTIQLAELIRHLNRAHEFSRNARGTFIEQTIWVDTFVSECLASYFVCDPVKRRLFISNVLDANSFTFSDRIDLLQRVLQTRSSWRPIEDTGQFINLLSKIRRFRNRLAHSKLDAEFDKDCDLDAPLQRIRISYVENGETKYQVITADEFNERLKETSQAVDILVKLDSELSAV